MPTLLSQKLVRMSTSLVALLILVSCSGASSESIEPSTGATSQEAALDQLTVAEPDSCPDYQDNYEPPYKYCDSGDDVLRIQQELTARGFAIDVDGYFGPATRSAVRTFQERNGLATTGQVNPRTWSVLMSPNGSADTPSVEPAAPTPLPPPVQIPQRFLVGTECDLRETGLTSSWYGTNYRWTYYDVWSDGARTIARSGSGYDPPADCW